MFTAEEASALEAFGVEAIPLSESTGAVAVTLLGEDMVIFPRQAVNSSVTEFTGERVAEEQGSDNTGDVGALMKESSWSSRVPADVFRGLPCGGGLGLIIGQ